jgi:hypothetical protein
LLVGVTLESVCRLGFRTRGECRLTVGAAVFQSIAAMAAPLVKVARPFEISALLTAVCLAAAALFLWRRKWRPWVFMSALSSLVLICSALTFSREHVEAESSARPVAERLLQLRQNGEPLLSGKFLIRGLIYYTRLPVTVLASKAQPFWAAHPLPVVVWKGQGLEKFLATHPTALCAIRVPEWQTLSKNPAFADGDGLEESGPNVLVRAHAPATDQAGAALPAQ